MARPDDPEGKKQESAEILKQLGDKLTCKMLRMSPTACFGCQDNPRGTETKRFNAAMLSRHKEDFERMERLHDAVRMGLLKMADLTALEFEMLRGYWWETEKIRMKSGVRL